MFKKIREKKWFNQKIYGLRLGTTKKVGIHEHWTFTPGP